MSKKCIRSNCRNASRSWCKRVYAVTETVLIPNDAVRRDGGDPMIHVRHEEAGAMPPQWKPS
jgi:hypothetical protein